LLVDIPGLPPTPKAGGRTTLAGLNLTNIQGDIIAGMKKPKELFFFYSINNATAYKAALKKTVVPLVTSTATLIGPASGQPAALVNVAYSQSGLKKLNVNDNLGDSVFAAGQFADAANLKDNAPATNWVKAFQGTSVHGVFLIASDQDASINSTLSTITTAFGSAITESHRISGAARPGNQAGHEHFGFLDGIAQPAISGFGTPLPGQAVLPAGNFLLNETGDSTTRPAWAKDGSFLAFRKLQQFVPEFNKFLLDNPTNGSSELTGARMVGRWKSGAPVDLSPLKDDPTLGADATRNQNFTFDHPEIKGFNFNSDQTRCPFSAHIRKTHPRADLASNVAILRSGIPYGPEVAASESSSNKTTTERGLAFVAYQSVIANGFQFQQVTWADNANFIFNKNDTSPGLDPIIGQAGNGAARVVSGIDVKNANHDLTIPAFILSRGGEYFFSPPISALNDPIGK
jgi:Dyp-type peroxidase family